MVCILVCNKNLKLKYEIKREIHFVENNTEAKSQHGES